MCEYVLVCICMSVCTFTQVTWGCHLFSINLVSIGSERRQCMRVHCTISTAETDPWAHCSLATYFHKLSLRVIAWAAPCHPWQPLPPPRPSSGSYSLVCTLGATTLADWNRGDHMTHSGPMGFSILDIWTRGPKMTAILLYTWTGRPDRYWPTKRGHEVNTQRQIGKSSSSYQPWNSCFSSLGRLSCLL